MGFEPAATGTGTEGASYVLELSEIDGAEVALAGGKGARLGELSRIEDIEVPPGFCVTTHAFRQLLAGAPAIRARIEGLSRLEPKDRDGIRALSAEVRRLLGEAALPADVTAAITRALAGPGAERSYAVRSSATDEDEASSSLAGLHDSHLGVPGPAAVVAHVRRCWASLFTERAVAHRLSNGIDQRAVQMAVVVQELVPARAAGTLFTADPVTSNRRVAAIEATFGLGEPLVSGLVEPDLYTVRDGEVIERAIAAKGVELRATSGGGTAEQEVEPARASQPALTDEQAVRLVALGRILEAHFGSPQDIEWCLADGGFVIVQSRPITTLFPIPAREDREPHVYVSVGHQQMMTDPMRPLGLSLFGLTALRPMYEAGGRLFVDVARDLASPAARERVLALGRSDPLIGDALEAVLERGGLIPAPPTDDRGAVPGSGPAQPDSEEPLVSKLVARAEASLAALEREIAALSGPELIDFILGDIPALKRLISEPDSSRAIMAAMTAAWWLDEHLGDWLGEKDAAERLSRSVPDNITSQMGLELLDVADAIRPHPQVVSALERVEDGDFLDALPGLGGGTQVRDAIQRYLERYGMRCAGEIDITRPRWRERPSALVPAILSNVRSFQPGAAVRRFEQGAREAAETERDVLRRLAALPGGQQKAQETKLTIDRLRTYAGYREYPKYAIVSRYFVYKRALMAEADRLAAAGVIGDREDVFELTLHELRELLRTKRLDRALIAERKAAARSYARLVPPRVLTSDGEVFTGSYRRGELPAGALPGLAVSGGTVEGRARVALEMGEADLQPGDILVTAYTDPGWTAVFPVIAALVTEVGGLMTHGAVIAREYGLPAVVGVEHATRRIEDGERIRVHGAEGYVEILS